MSSFGNVRSLDRLVNMAHGAKRKVLGRVLKPFISKPTGYLQISMHGKAFNIHRLVAFAFCDCYAEGLQVNHKNGNKGDNRAENLEWVTASENQRHSYAVLGTKPSSLGKFSGFHPTAKAVVSIDIESGERKEYAAAMDAVREGFDSGCISRCCNNIAAHHKGRVWMYADATA